MPRKRKADEFVINNFQNLAKDKDNPWYYRVICTVILSNIAGLTSIPVFMPGARSKPPTEPPAEPATPNPEQDPDIEKELKAFEQKYGGVKNGVSTGH